MSKFIIISFLILLYSRFYNEIEKEKENHIFTYYNGTNITLQNNENLNIIIYPLDKIYTILFDLECEPIYKNSIIDIELEETGKKILYWHTIYLQKETKITQSYLYTTKINTTSLIIFKATNSSLCKKIILYKQISNY